MTARPGGRVRPRRRRLRAALVSVFDAFAFGSLVANPWVAFASGAPPGGGDSGVLYPFMWGYGHWSGGLGALG